jgi:hypothetical protein
MNEQNKGVYLRLRGADIGLFIYNILLFFFISRNTPLPVYGYAPSPLKNLL